ncbi:hypothetical protein [Lysinibacillus fusiformis]|uniref:nucleotide-binding domain-containing protein n=1 Tax=Lysinibacillus fusiformis TaxID=28031 RepID=UPI00382AB39C
MGRLSEVLGKGQTLNHGLGLYFTATTNAILPYKIYWKAKNNGDVAKKNDNIRGELLPSLISENPLFHYEETSFNGDQLYNN